MEFNSIKGNFSTFEGGTFKMMQTFGNNLKLWNHS